MKSLIIPLALVVSASASAGDWVSVGASSQGAPASTSISSGNPVVPVAPITPVTAVNTPAQGNLMSELLMQIDQMQQEIAQLRGTVESQSMKIKRLEKDSETRYLDLDRRIVFLTTANGSGASATTPSASSTATTDTSASSSASTSVSSTASDSSAASSEPTSSASAEDAYNAAMALVKDKQFAAANKAFEQFVKTYPNDALTANAYYWNGEVYMVRQELASAITSFRKVIDKYPDHVKAPDATYKYAVALDKSGDKAGAIEWLKTVVKRYSGKADGTVRLAQSYLDKLNAGG